MKNAAIVGYGAIGPTHAKALEPVESVRLYAVCDVNPEKLKIASDSFEVKTYTDFDLMLSDENIDSVHICTPHYLHFEMIKKALSAGKEVVCEKPVTMTKKEYTELLALENSGKVCVILQNRFNPCIEKIKELSQGLGKLLAVKGILTWQRTMDYYNRDKWRGNWDTEGGGVLINQAVHTLDLMGYIAGDIKSLRAVMTNFSLDEIEVEDTFSARLNFENSLSGIFFATNAYSDSSAPQLEFVFEKGFVRYIDSKLYLDGELIMEDEKSEYGKSYWGKSHEKLFKNYYERGEFFSPHSIKNTMLTMFAMYESAKSGGKEIKI
ncbi:MAG: Gfo/Idh/MocA family oxidoreductase [Monoglobales bacterium]